MAGTTAICYCEHDSIRLVQSAKRQDADAFCESYLNKFYPTFVMIDAPLSLPGVYQNRGDDYFFRQCDRELGAMSPMFLGGLTARAMRLSQVWMKKGIVFYETWPRRVAGRFGFGQSSGLDERSVKAIVQQIEAETACSLAATIPSQHAFDALLAWYAGWCAESKKIQRAGSDEEGWIYY